MFGPESLLEIIRTEAADIVKVKIMKQGGPLRRQGHGRHGGRPPA